MDDAEDLRDWEHEVNDLGNEKQEHCLWEMPKDPYHREGHACEVAEGVSNKHFWREFVMVQESKCDHDEGNDDRERKDMLGHLERWDGKVYFL